jgi:hypothetical protein
MTDDRRDRIKEFWTPDPSIVESRTDKGVTLSYVGHVHTSATLDDIDPDWQLELVTTATGMPDIQSRPYRVTRRDGSVAAEGNMLTLWGKITVLGFTRWCVGSVDALKPDAEKELIGDVLRNGAMRVGVFAGLWSKDMPGKATESHAERSAPRPRSQTTQQEDAFAGAIVSDWTDDPMQQAVWTTEHVQRIARLLHSNPDKMMTRLLAGLADKGHDTSNGWQSVSPDEWVRAVLTFEGWAERKAAERANA